MSNQTENKLFYFTDDYVCREIAGEEVRFWPSTLAATRKLRSVLRPLGDVLTRALFRDTLQGSREESVQEGGLNQKVFVVEAPSVEMVDAQARLRRESAEKLADLLTDKSVQEDLTYVIMDSCHDVWARPFDGKTVTQTAAEMPLPVFMSFLRGVFAANAEVVAPFTEQIETTLKAQGVDLKLVQDDQAGPASKPGSSPASDTASDCGS